MTRTVLLLSTLYVPPNLALSHYHLQQAYMIKMQFNHRLLGLRTIWSTIVTTQLLQISMLPAALSQDYGETEKQTVCPESAFQRSAHCSSGAVAPDSLLSLSWGTHRPVLMYCKAQNGARTIRTSCSAQHCLPPPWPASSRPCKKTTLPLPWYAPCRLFNLVQARQVNVYQWSV